MQIQAKRVSLTKTATLIALVSLCAFPVPALASEVIRNYEVDAKVSKDSSMDVTETITIDFGGDSKHGITRDFGSSQRVSVYSVVDKKNRKYETSIFDSAGRTSVRVGSPSKTVTGSNVYRIHYKLVGGAIDDNGDIDWSPTGHYWAQPIEKFKLHLTAELPLPKMLPVARLGTQKLAVTKLAKVDAYQVLAQNVQPNQGVDLQGKLGSQFGHPGASNASSTSKVVEAAETGTSKNWLVELLLSPWFPLVSVFGLIGICVAGIMKLSTGSCGCRGNSRNCRCVSSCPCVKKHGWIIPAGSSGGGYSRSNWYDNDNEDYRYSNNSSSWSSSSSDYSGGSSCGSSDSGSSGSDGGGDSW